MKSVRIGNRWIGPGHPTYVVAEVGINHNGDVQLAKRLVEGAKWAGCDAVKFQKRTLELVYSQSELNAPRESVFGVTNGDLKRGLEFGAAEYREINECCESLGLDWFASCWDPVSVEFLEEFEPPCYKISSACLTDDALLRVHRQTGRPLLLSTGMSTLEEVDHAVSILGTDNLVLLHCTSAYPCNPGDLHLRLIQVLAQRYDVPTGYSGHEVGLATTVAAVALGACVVERHVTMDRAMWGSDQASSVEMGGMARLLKDIRAVELAMGESTKRVLPSETSTRAKLRRDRP